MSKRRRERPKITARGKGLVGMSVATIGIGSMVGGSLLVQIGLLGVLMLLVAHFLALQNMKRLRVRRRVPRTVFAGFDFDLEIEVENQKRWLSARNVTVFDHLLPFTQKGVECEFIRAGQNIVENFRTRVIERGRVVGKGYRIRSEFPLGLFRVTSRRRGNESMLVYPRPMLTSAVQVAAAGTGPGNLGSTMIRDVYGEICGVREFQRGDRINQVMWPTFARTGKLVVREYDRALPKKYSLVFHSYCPPGKLIWPEVFEHSMSLIVGLMLLCREQNVPFDICGPFTGWKSVEVTDPRLLSAPLEWLAMAQYEPETDLNSVSAALISLPGSHPIFVVSGTSVDLWADKLPELSRVVNCVDNSVLKSKRPKLKVFRSVA